MMKSRKTLQLHSPNTASKSLQRLSFFSYQRRIKLPRKKFRQGMLAQIYSETSMLQRLGSQRPWIISSGRISVSGTKRGQSFGALAPSGGDRRAALSPLAFPHLVPAEISRTSRRNHRSAGGTSQRDHPCQRQVQCCIGGENSPNRSSRYEPLNRGSRRESALTSLKFNWSGLTPAAWRGASR